MSLTGWIDARKKSQIDLPIGTICKVVFDDAKHGVCGAITRVIEDSDTKEKYFDNGQGDIICNVIRYKAISEEEAKEILNPDINTITIEHGGKIYEFNGVPGIVTEAIIAFMTEQSRVDPLASLLGTLMRHASRHSEEENGDEQE